MQERPVNRNAPLGLIATPSSYYSTAKAKYLGDRYKENLDRIVERIVRNSKTATLQFANNIAGVGGIGFFTHSATKAADERYLEVVLGIPDTFPAKEEQSAKVSRLLSMYGTELLSILSSDSEISQETEVAGYGLNFSWRGVVTEPAGSRIILERAVVYASKEKVRSFLRQEIDQNSLLAGAVIFAAREDAPLTLVSYRGPEPMPDYRALVREETIVGKKRVPNVTSTQTDRAESSRFEEAPKSEKVNASPSGLLSQATPPTEETKASAESPKLPQAKDGFAIPATKELLPSQVPPDLKATQPATAAKLREPNEKAAGSKLAELTEPPPAVALEDTGSEARSGNSTTGAGSSPQSVATAKAPGSVDKTKTGEGESPARPAKEKSDMALSTSRATQAQDKQPGAKSLAPQVKTRIDEPQPASVGAAKPNQSAEDQPTQAITLKTASKSAAVRPSPARSLEGYIIQLAFAEKNAARRWAETFEGRGYAVSVTLPDAGGAIRVRLGNFFQREEAERQLQRLRQDGLSGIVLNLPQAYRPEVSPRAEDVTDKP